MAAGNIHIDIIGDARSLKRAVRESEAATGKLDSRFGSVKRSALAFGAGALGVVAVGLEESVKAAVAAEKSQARLDQAFKNAHISAGPLKDSLDQLEAAGRKLGFTDEDTKNSLASLITSTGSYKQSVQQLSIAQDLARFKGVALTDATKALTMAHAGSLRPLKQLGIDIPKVTTAQDALKASTDNHTSAQYKAALATAKLQDKQATFRNVLQTVTDKVHGQADAYSKTASGSMAQFNAQVEHIKVSLGEKLLPFLTLAINRVNLLADRFDELHSQLQPVISAFESVSDKSDKAGIHFGTLGKITLTMIDPLTKTLFILRAVSTALSTVAHWAEAAASAVEDLIRSLGHIHVPNIHIPGVHIPHLAAGGIVTRPTLALVGEAGPEAVVPLGGQTPVGVVGGGGNTYVLNAPNYVGNKQELFSAWRQEFVKFQNRGGKL